MDSPAFAEVGRICCVATSLAFCCVAASGVGRHDGLGASSSSAAHGDDVPGLVSSAGRSMSYVSCGGELAECLLVGLAAGFAPEDLVHHARVTVELAGDLAVAEAATPEGLDELERGWSVCHGQASLGFQASDGPAFSHAFRSRSRRAIVSGVRKLPSTTPLSRSRPVRPSSPPPWVSGIAHDGIEVV